MLRLLQNRTNKDNRHLQIPARCSLGFCQHLIEELSSYQLATVVVSLFSASADRPISRVVAVGTIKSARVTVIQSTLIIQTTTVTTLAVKINSTEATVGCKSRRSIVDALLSTVREIFDITELAKLVQAFGRVYTLSIRL